MISDEFTIHVLILYLFLINIIVKWLIYQYDWYIMPYIMDIKLKIWPVLWKHMFSYVCTMDMWNGSRCNENL